MKNTFLLLAVLFTFGLNGYGQVANQPDDIELCDDVLNDGIEAFDLTATNSQILGAQDPFEFIISFHLTLADAQNGVLAIANPAAYFNVVNPQAVYVRLESIANGNFDTTSFALIVNPIPSPTTPTPLEVCDDDNDGFTEFNLNDKDLEIVNGEPGVTISYYETLSGAQSGDPSLALASPYSNVIASLQTVYASVQNDITGCINTTPLDLVVNNTPDTPTADFFDALVVCDNDVDGFASFDLTINDASVLGTQNPSDFWPITYHETESDAGLGMNAISPATNYINTSNPQTVWVRLAHIATGCQRITPFELIVEIGCPVIEQEPDDIFINEGDDNGLAVFDLTLSEPEMLGNQDPLIYLFSYHVTFDDSVNGENDIATPEGYQNIANPQTIYVRLSNDNTGTFALTNFDIETDGILGIDEVTTTNFVIYPNPTGDEIVISSRDFESTASIYVFDLQGKKVISETNTILEEELRLNISQLKSGMYFVQILSEGVIRTERIIKK